MFRSFFIVLSKSTHARSLVTNWPVAWKMAGRFVAGESIQDAIRVITLLNSRGIFATLDHLGEHTDSKEAAEKATNEIIDALDYVDSTNVRANISVKLTQLGLVIDKGLCSDNLRKILIHAQKCNNFIRIDMEDSSVTQATLELLMEMRSEGFMNLGIVIQSYLYRSKMDLQLLINSGIQVRLCKGAYKEPSDIAFPKKVDVDRAYDELCELLIETSSKSGSYDLSKYGKFPPLTALATHDEKRINFACTTADVLHLEKNQLEFQMLYGIRREMQTKLADLGYPVRIYVPYGTEWYPYFMRRLAERPANVWFFITNLLRN